MIPKFTTPCYVRVDDLIKRKEICTKLEQIGYTLSDFTKRHLKEIPEFTQISTSTKTCNVHVTSNLSAVHSVVGRIDCGENTDLFLALAGMRSDTTLNQWIKRTDMPKHEPFLWDKDYPFPPFTARLTAQEIIETKNCTAL